MPTLQSFQAKDPFSEKHGPKIERYKMKKRIHNLRTELHATLSQMGLSGVDHYPDEKITDQVIDI